MSITRIDNQIDNIIDLDITRKIERPSGGGGSVVPFSPTDLPELELWLDANEGIINTAGNYFTDETRSIELANFPILDEIEVINPNGTLQVNGKLNNKNFYTKPNTIPESSGRYPVEVFWDQANNRWTLYYQALAVDDGSYTSLEFYGVGDTEYPWQATWADGTVTPTATTVDVPATNDETVERWNNKVSGKPNLNQFTLASRPVFKSDVFGRKAVYFNGDVLYGFGFSTFDQEYSYYLVSTSLLGAFTGTPSSAIRLGTSTAPTAFRGLFGAKGLGAVFQEPLAVQNSNVIKEVDASRYITNNNNAGVFSARFNLSAGEVTIGRMLSNFLTTENNTSTANTSTILIGAGSTSGATRPTDSNFSEVLVYRAFHDNDTALQVINYLVQKWNIDPNL